MEHSIRSSYQLCFQQFQTHRQYVDLLGNQIDLLIDFFPELGGGGYTIVSKDFIQNG